MFDSIKFTNILGVADSSGKIFFWPKFKLSVACVLVGISRALSLSELYGYKKSHEMLENTILILLLLGVITYL